MGSCASLEEALVPFEEVEEEEDGDDLLDDFLLSSSLLSLGLGLYHP